MQAANSAIMLKRWSQTQITCLNARNNSRYTSFNTDMYSQIQGIFQKDLIKKVRKKTQYFDSQNTSTLKG